MNNSATVSVVAREARVNAIPVYSMSVRADTNVSWAEGDEADPAWSFTDSQGHFHAWAQNDGPARDTPTLRAVSRTVICDGSCGGACDGEYERVVHGCVLCGEPVERGFRSGRTPLFGRTLYTALVTGPPELAQLEAQEVSVSFPTRFGTGFLNVDSASFGGSQGDMVSAAVRLRALHTRPGAGDLMPVRYVDVSDVDGAVAAGAEAMNAPWKVLSREERLRLVDDFHELAARRAVTAALAHLGLDERGQPSPVTGREGTP